MASEGGGGGKGGRGGRETIKDATGKRRHVKIGCEKAILGVGAALFVDRDWVAESEPVPEGNETLASLTRQPLKGGIRGQCQTGRPPPTSHNIGRSLSIDQHRAKQKRQCMTQECVATCRRLLLGCDCRCLCLHVHLWTSRFPDFSL